MTWVKYILLASMFAGSAVWARAQKAPGLPTGPVLKGEGKERPKEDSAKAIAIFTVRPTWYQGDPTFEMQNTVELGIKFSDKFALSYSQDFNTNTTKTGNYSQAELAPILFDGFIRANFSKVSVSDDKLFSYSNQLRVYFPTNSDKRDAGMLTTVRDYFVFDRTITSSLSFTFYEVPIVHVYDRSGYTDGKGKDVAHPIFENRVILEPSFKVFPKVTLGVPLNFTLVKFRDHSAKATNNDEWVPSLTFSPWIEWQVTDPIALGFYYETASVADKTEAGLVWTDGQKAGFYQFYLRVGL